VKIHEARHVCELAVSRKPYQTDVTDAGWRVIAPQLPKPRATGRPRQWPMREIINGFFYITRAGCSWRLLPNDLPS
jgi:putative transposase